MGQCRAHQERCRDRLRALSLCREGQLTPLRLALRDLGLVLACISLGGCHARYGSAGEKLARTYCAACHAFPEPGLLDKETWRSGVLPQMAARLGIRSESS